MRDAGATDWLVDDGLDPLCRIKAAVLDAAADPVLVGDDAGMLVALNHAAETLLGVDEAACLGRPLTDFLSHWQHEAWHDGLTVAVDVQFPGGAKAPASLDLRRVRLADRTFLAATMRQTPKATGPSGLTPDLLALLGDVAHELNNPLAVLMAQSELLRDKAPTADVERRAAKIQAAAQRAGRVVKTFVAMARRNTPILSVLDVEEVVDDTLELVGHGLRAAEVDVVRERAGVPLRVHADRDHLEQVFAHVIMDARATLETRSQGRRLVIRTEAGPSLVEIDVIDNGGPTSLALTGAGNGIGAQLCRFVLDAHSGTLSVDRLAEGLNRTRIVLPAIAPAVQSRSSSALSILVVDDEIDVAESLSELIGLFGHTVVIETSTDAAMLRIGHEPFDVVFTDYRMPGRNGLAFIRSIAKLDPSLAERTVLVTGDHLEGDAANARSGTIVLRKPFTARDVKSLLDRFARP